MTTNTQPTIRGTDFAENALEAAPVGVPSPNLDARQMLNPVASLILDLTALLKSKGLTIHQYNILSFLITGEKKMSSIAAHLDVTTAAVTGAIDRMEALKLVKRANSRADRRVINVSITNHGTAFIELINEGITTRHSKVVAS